MSLYLGNSLISGVATPVEGARNVGQIVQSTIPLTDAGLHLLDGALISGSGSYADFVTYISNLDLSASYFCTEAEWQDSVTQYGVCGKFVYDSVNNTVRLPKYSNKIYTGGGIANAKGNGKVLGIDTELESESYRHVVSIASGTGGGDLYISPSTGGNYGNASNHIGVTTDPTKSGIITDLSTITTSLDGYWYIVIATSTKTDIEVDIDEIATDLNGKADVDLSNMNPSASARESIVGLIIPDYTAGVTKTAETQYTADSAGEVRVNYFSYQYGWYRATVNGNGLIFQTTDTNDGLGHAYTSQGYVSGSFYVNKGDTWSINYVRGTVSELQLIFYPCRGV